MNKQAKQNVAWCAEDALASLEHARDVARATAGCTDIRLLEQAYSLVSDFLEYNDLDEGN